MSDISPSSIQTDKNLEEQLKNAGNVEQLKQILRDAACAQALVQKDAFDPSILIPTGRETQPQPQSYAKSITVNGQKHILESDSEIGLAQAEANLFRELISANEPKPPVARNDRGQFESTDDDTAKFATSWATCTEEFKKSAAGRDWPGGAENLRLMGELLIEKNLADHPSVESLTEAYETLKRENRLVSTPAMVAHARINEATSTEEIRTACHALFGR